MILLSFHILEIVFRKNKGNYALYKSLLFSFFLNPERKKNIYSLLGVMIGFENAWAALLYLEIIC